MSLDFPNSPAIGATFTLPNGMVVKWDGAKWVPFVLACLPLTGGTLTGPLVLAADPTVNLDAATKQYVDAKVLAGGGGGGGTGNVPAGGTSGQVLAKNSATDYDTKWAVMSDPTRLPLAGGTLSGAVMVSPAAGLDAQFTLNKANAGRANNLIGETNGSMRWALVLGDGNAESGGNVGSGLAFNRYTDAGGFIDSPLTINRVNGQVNLTGPLVLAADPSAALGAATKQYVDGKTGGGRVLLNTLTGNSSPVLADTTSLMNGSYSAFEITWIDVVPATAGALLQMQVFSGGAYQATGYVGGAQSISGSSLSWRAGPATALAMDDNGGGPLAGTGLSGTWRINNPAQAVSPKKIWGQYAYINTATAMETGPCGGFWNGGNGAITGFQIKFSSGNITSGVVKIYGVP